jgi:hypothetical protein
MIIIDVIYPNNQVVRRNLFPSQAQGIIDAMRADGATVVIIENPTNYIVK